MRDFESDLTVLILRPFDDGRFLLKVNGRTLYDKDRTTKFPKYVDDVKARLEELL